MHCQCCNSENLVFCGKLGAREYFRCKQCGLDQARVPEAKCDFCHTAQYVDELYPIRNNREKCWDHACADCHQQLEAECEPSYIGIPLPGM